MANQMIEKIETDGAKAVWRMYQATNGVISGLPVLSADEDRITRTLTTKYCNGATGTAITDGFDVGIAANGTAEIRQRENLPLVLYTNNQSRITIDANGVTTLSSLAGTGNRMIVADATGNLSASDTVVQRFTINSVSSTTFVNLEVTLAKASVNDIIIGFSNVAIGTQGWARFMKSTTTGLTQIAMIDGTGCGVSFQAIGQELQAKVTTGNVKIHVKIESIGTY